jgi:hypothetical protein
MVLVALHDESDATIEDSESTIWTLFLVDKTICYWSPGPKFRNGLKQQASATTIYQYCTWLEASMHASSLSCCACEISYLSK